VGHKKDRLRLAAARAQCAHCNERTGPYVADGVKGSETQSAYGDKPNRKLSDQNPHEDFLRFACRRCGGAYGPVLRSAKYTNGNLPTYCKKGRWRRGWR
jgi:hypothetical protein